jgi:hypothetical protein
MKRSDPPPMPAVLEPVRFSLIALLVAGLTLLATCVGGMACGSMIAKAQVSDERALALAVAKVAVNEATLAEIEPADVALIAQVTEQHGATAHAKLAWLSLHSSCVLTDRELRPGERRTNCIWTRGLTDSDREPAGFAESQSAPWRSYVARWRDVRITALALVQHRSRVPYPCEGRPTTWGSRRLDLRRAIERGLRPLVCSTRGNVGFVREGES